MSRARALPGFMSQEFIVRGILGALIIILQTWVIIHRDVCEGLWRVNALINVLRHSQAAELLPLGSAWRNTCLIETLCLDYHNGWLSFMPLISENPSILGVQKT